MNKSIQMWKPSYTPQSQKPYLQRPTQLPSVAQENSLSSNTSSEHIYEEIPSFAVKSTDGLLFTPISKVAKRLNYQDQTASIKNSFLSQFSPIVSTTSTKQSIVHRSSILRIKDYEGNHNELHDYKGQIKVKIHTSNSELIVDICQAKDLPSINCDSFVQVSLIDEQSEVLSFHTSVVYQSHNPVYREKFTYELLQEDYRKRILISVWNFEEVSKEGVFVGCMSFGIENIVARNHTVSGWYYLLEENIGEHKHMFVKECEDNLYEVPISMYYNTHSAQTVTENGSLSSTVSSDSGHFCSDNVLV